MKTLASLLACSLLATACRSGAAVPEVRLPFHVALAPVELGALGSSLADEASRRGDFQVEWEAGEVQRLEELLVAALDRRCFTAVTLLEASDGGTAAESRVAQATAIGADLLLECRLLCNPEVRTETNDRFALNLPLFLLLGPASFFVNDRDYYASAELNGTFYDLSRLADGRAELTAPAVRALDLSAEFEKASFDFMARTRGEPLKLVMGFVVPPGWVAKQTPAVERKLKETVLAELAQGFFERVQQRRNDLIEGKNMPYGNFFVDLDTLVLQREPAGGVRLACEVVLREGGNVDELSGFSARGSGAPVEASWRPDERRADTSEGPGSSAYYRYQIDEIVAVAPEAETLRLELVDNDFRVRTFTLPIEPRPE